MAVRLSALRAVHYGVDLYIRSPTRLHDVYVTAMCHPKRSGNALQNYVKCICVTGQVLRMPPS
jgi:hypothetical protein